MSGGGSKSEVRWELVCHTPQSPDVEFINESQGRSPFDREISIPTCSNCALYMKDTYGDGWQGGKWNGFGLTFGGPLSSDG